MKKKISISLVLTAFASCYIVPCLSETTAQERRVPPSFGSTVPERPAPPPFGGTKDQSAPRPFGSPVERPDPLLMPTSPRSFEERLRELAPEERTAVQVYEKCNRGTVNVDTKVLQRSFWSVYEVEAERGSGIVLDKKGHILTNFHVVEDSRAVQITLFNGKSYAAEVIGADPQTDIAVFKIDTPQEELFPIELADSSHLLVGQKVFAIGNPFGLERTLTSGIISSLDRTINSRVRNRSIRQAIQIDAAINPGNSGGPLLDSKGRMIGLNTAIASRVGENSGVGFSIPSNIVSRIVPILIENGKVARVEIGVIVYRTPDGLMVQAVQPGSSAERAGLKGPEIVREQSTRGGFRMTRERTDTSTADVITEVNEKPVKTAEEFYSIIEEHKIGDRVIITVQRKGKTVKVPVTLENAPAEKTPYRGI